MRFVSVRLVFLEEIYVRSFSWIAFLQVEKGKEEEDCVEERENEKE